MTGLTKTFQDRLDEAKSGCAAIARGLRNVVQLKWMFSGSTEESTKPSKFDFVGLHEEFSRSEAEENFMKAVEDAGSADGSTNKVPTKQDLAINKMQSDFLSGMERDLQMRRRSRIRMLAHETVARNYTGSDAGTIQSGILEYAQRQLQRFDTKESSDGDD